MKTFILRLFHFHFLSITISTSGKPNKELIKSRGTETIIIDTNYVKDEKLILILEASIKLPNQKTDVFKIETIIKILAPLLK